MFRKLKEIIKIFKLVRLELTKNKREAKIKILELDNLHNRLNREKSCLEFLLNKSPVEKLLSDKIKSSIKLYKEMLSELVNKSQIDYIYAKRYIKNQDYQNAVLTCEQSVSFILTSYDDIIADVTKNKEE